ncbi:MAG: LuxR C-terminal-related transcriptional regulator [Flavobacteriaceae bacterium]|nr:LuxR C-terminal-related transcriptional regulator [Flavobacteriaceae bacterium]
MEPFSSREIEVLKFLIDGKRNIEIAATLKINQKTVNTYKSRLMKKLDVNNAADLYQQAFNLELI